jgi:hypothetical protein
MDKMNKLKSEDFMKMRKMFLVTMESIRNTFGGEAFAKYRYQDGSFSRMSKFNAAVFDALSIPVVMFINIDRPILSQNSVSEFR